MPNSAVFFVTEGAQIWAASDRTLARIARQDYLDMYKRFKGRAELLASSSAKVDRSKDGEMIDVNYFNKDGRLVFKISYFRGPERIWKSRR